MGMALLQAAKVCRRLVPLGYLAQAVEQAARAVVEQQQPKQPNQPNQPKQHERPEPQPEPEPGPEPSAAAALECERLMLCVGALDQALLFREEPSRQPSPLSILGSLLQQALLCVVGLQSP